MEACRDDLDRTRCRHLARVTRSQLQGLTDGPLLSSTANSTEGVGAVGVGAFRRLDLGVCQLYRV